MLFLLEAGLLLSCALREAPTPFRSLTAKVEQTTLGIEEDASVYQSLTPLSVLYTLINLELRLDPSIDLVGEITGIVMIHSIISGCPSLAETIHRLLHPDGNLGGLPSLVWVPGFSILPFLVQPFRLGVLSVFGSPLPSCCPTG